MENSILIKYICSAMQYSNSSINHFHQVSNSGSSEPLSGHSTHFQVGGDNSKVEGGPVKQLSKIINRFYYIQLYYVIVPLVCLY
jgi:hypothetical protein